MLILQMLNEGMFAGENGWVLKPTGYLGTRGKGATIDRSISPRTLELRIELFAAQGLPTAEEGRDAKKLRPYVKIQLHVDDSASEDVKGNTGNGKEVLKQRSKTSSGPDADFGGEVFQFSKIQGVIEELSFLRYVRIYFYDAKCPYPFQQPSAVFLLSACLHRLRTKRCGRRPADSCTCTLDYTGF